MDLVPISYEASCMWKSYSLIIEVVFITAVFGYLAFQLLRTYCMHLAENHPAIKRILIKLHLDDAA